MGNVQAGGHAPQERNLHPPLIIEGSKVQNSLEALQQRANLTHSRCFIAASEKDESRFALCLRAKHGASDQDGFKALHWAVLSSFPAGVTLALNSGIPVDVPSREGYTPLHLACFVGSAECAAILVENGANVNTRSARGATPLGIAAQQGEESKAVLEFLLQNGASPTSYGYKNRNALETAIYSHGEVEILQTLIAAGADPSFPNPHINNSTPMHIAARMLNCDVVKTLLQAGGNPNALADQNIAPLMMVYSTGRSPSNGNLSRSALEEKKRALVNVLCEGGADVSAGRSRRGGTVLHLAVASSNDEASIDQLLSEPTCKPGININQILSPNKETMLHVCAGKGWVNATRQLVSAGADMDVENKEGLNPLHIAVIEKQAGTVAVMLESGASPLSLGPDIFPDFNIWRMKQGTMAARMFVQGVETEEMLERLRAINAQVTAIDTAFLVTQDIAVIETFLQAGVFPSDEARAVGLECVPVLGNVIERTVWSPAMHKTLPNAFKSAAKGLVLSLKRAACGSDGQALVLSEDVLSVILTHALYPISQWADDDWIRSQRVKEPNQVERPNQTVPEDAAAGGADGMLPAGVVHNFNFNMPEPEAILELAAAAAVQLVQAAAVGGGGGGGAAAAGNAAAAAGGAAVDADEIMDEAIDAAIANAAVQLGMVPNPNLNNPGAGVAGAGGINAANGNAAAAGHPAMHHFPQGMPIMQMQMHLPGGFMMMGGPAMPGLGPGGFVFPNGNAGDGNGGGGGNENGFDNFEGAAAMNAAMMGMFDVAGAHIANILNGADEDEEELEQNGGGGHLLHLQININVDDVLNNINEGNNGGGGGGLINHPVAQHAAQFLQQQHNQQPNHQPPAAAAAVAEAGPPAPAPPPSSANGQRSHPPRSAS